MKEVILFHGTRANPKSITEKGLLAGGLDRKVKDPLTEKYIVNKETTLQRVLKEFGLKKENVPEWTYKSELNYEKDQPIHIHFENSFVNACGYADMGGEPAYLIRKGIMDWIRMREIGDEETVLYHTDPERAKLHNKIAKEANGKTCYVIAVRIKLDDPRLEKRAKDIILRVKKAMDDGLIENDWLKFWNRNAHECRYYGDIKPEGILGIVAIDPKNLPVK